MKKIFFTLLTLSILMTSCNKEVDLFSISKQNIGLLTDSTQVKDLEAIYANDSIVKKALCYGNVECYKNGFENHFYNKRPPAIGNEHDSRRSMILPGN